MKNLLLILSMLFMMSCGTDTTKKNDVKADAEKEKTENAEKADDTPKNECEQFLYDYEAWVVEIENTRKELNADPSNDALKQKILQANQRNVNWVNKWDSVADCASNEAYDEKMLDIEDRLNKAVMI